MGRRGPSQRRPLPTRHSPQPPRRHSALRLRAWVTTVQYPLHDAALHQELTRRRDLIHRVMRRARCRFDEDLPPPTESPSDTTPVTPALYAVPAVSLTTRRTDVSGLAPQSSRTTGHVGPTTGDRSRSSSGSSLPGPSHHSTASTRWTFASHSSARPWHSPHGWPSCAVAGGPFGGSRTSCCRGWSRKRWRLEPSSPSTPF